jgi:tetratricopeptide (TPR) repeat protein
MNLFLFRADPTPTRREALVRETLDKLRRLRPDAGQTHLSIGIADYKVFHDPVHGRQEMMLARQKLQNNWRLLYLTGIADCVDGHWAEALDVIEQQLPLNPRSPNAVSQLLNIYYDLRRVDDARRVAENAIKAGINPDYYAMRHAMIAGDHLGELSEAHAYLQQASSQPDPKGTLFFFRYQLAARERDAEAAHKAVAAYYSGGIERDDPVEFWNARIELWQGDFAAAQKDYDTARPYYEAQVRRRPDFAGGLADLALLDAHAGHKEEALREGLKAVALAPLSRDTYEGQLPLIDLALDYAQTGNADRALTILESLENVPRALTYGDVLLDPDYDPLRGMPRFDAILQAIRKPVDLSKFNPADFPPPAVEP